MISNIIQTRKKLISFGENIHKFLVKPKIRLELPHPKASLVVFLRGPHLGLHNTTQFVLSQLSKN